MKNKLFSNPTPSPQRGIYEAIKKQVMTENELEFDQAVGWRKHWIKWKMNLITEIRYRGVLFLGVATELP